MKRRIQRLSPHQNGKVAAITMALVSLIVLVPLTLLFWGGMPHAGRPSLMMAVGMPLFYLVFGYLGTALACWVYNLVAGWVGGIEYETQDV